MGAKILVVDDEPDVAKGWARALTIAGHKVVEAQAPEVALKLCREHPLDLVILDYMMPAMTGIQLLNEIRKEYPHIRSIIISGKLNSSRSEESVLSDIRTEIDADLYLHKPVENSRLIDAVAELVAKKPDSDWKVFAMTKLGVSATKRGVRAAEKKLSKNRSRKS